MSVSTPGTRAARTRPAMRATARLLSLLLAVTATGMAATAVSASQLPTCRVADVTTAQRTEADWPRTVLDTTYRLTSAYGPIDLRSTAAAGLNDVTVPCSSKVMIRRVLAQLSGLAIKLA